MSAQHVHDFGSNVRTLRRRAIERVAAKCKCGMRVWEISRDGELLRRRYSLSNPGTLWLELAVSAESFFGGDPGHAQRMPVRIGIGAGGGDSIDFSLGDGRHVLLSLEEVAADNPHPSSATYST